MPREEQKTFTPFEGKKKTLGVYIQKERDE